MNGVYDLFLLLPRFLLHIYSSLQLPVFTNIIFSPLTLPHFSFIYHFSHISFTFVHTRNYCCAYSLERWLHCSVDFVSIFSPPLNRSLRASSMKEDCILLPFNHCFVYESYQQPFLLLATDNVFTTILVSMLFQLDPQINRACNPAFFFRESVLLAWIISTPSTLTSITTFWPSVSLKSWDIHINTRWLVQHSISMVPATICISE